MSQSLPASLLVDDYFMFLLERIREARLEFSAYFYEVTGQESSTVPDHIELLYPNVSLIEGHTATFVLGGLSDVVIALERELIDHVYLLLLMPDVVPLRQGRWHLCLNHEQIAQILHNEEKTRPLVNRELWEFDEANDSASFGYPPALIIETLYWPLRAAHLSSNADQ